MLDISNTTGLPQGSEPLVPTSGTAFSGVYNILSSAFDKYASFYERNKALKILENEQANQQTVALANAGYFNTTAENAQTYILYGATALVVLGLGYYALKKAF